jgi:hypothetical protein
MTKRDLIDAYVRGDVDRRGFIRGLSALGVSAAAATAYAGTFGRDAAAAPSRNDAGFVSRLQDADGEYGIAVAIENINRALEGFAERSDVLVDRLEQIADRTGGNGPDPDRIRKIRDQIEEQRQAVVTRLQQRLQERGEAQSSVHRLTGRTPRLQEDASLADIANELNLQTGVLAALIPNIEIPQDLQLMTNLGLVTARHAAVVSDLAGIDPIPGAFEVPIDPATV